MIFKETPLQLAGALTTQVPVSGNPLKHQPPQCDHLQHVSQWVKQPSPEPASAAGNHLPYRHPPRPHLFPSLNPFSAPPPEELDELCFTRSWPVRAATSHGEPGQKGSSSATASAPNGGRQLPGTISVDHSAAGEASPAKASLARSAAASAGQEARRQPTAPSLTWAAQRYSHPPPQQRRACCSSAWQPNPAPTALTDRGRSQPAAAAAPRHAGRREDGARSARPSRARLHRKPASADCSKAGAHGRGNVPS